MVIMQQLCVGRERLAALNEAGMCDHGLAEFGLVDITSISREGMMQVFQNGGGLCALGGRLAADGRHRP
jgi:hypothetical protein